MGQSTPIKPRKRQFAPHLTVAEAQLRASELFARTESMPIGNARAAVLKEACDYRMLAEMKRLISVPKEPLPK